MSDTDKLILIRRLVIECGNMLILKFLNTDSYEMLDEKIDVLTRLKNGEKPKDISNFYDILEDYPKNEEIWD